MIDFWYLLTVFKFVPFYVISLLGGNECQRSEHFGRCVCSENILAAAIMMIVWDEDECVVRERANRR